MYRPSLIACNVLRHIYKNIHTIARVFATCKRGTGNMHDSNDNTDTWLKKTDRGVVL